MSFYSCSPKSIVVASSLNSSTRTTLDSSLSAKVLSFVIKIESTALAMRMLSANPNQETVESFPFR